MLVPRYSALSSAFKQFLREQKLFRPQLLDRIPQLRRFLELETLGGFAHVAFEFHNVAVQFFLLFEFRHAFGFAAG